MNKFEADFESVGNKFTTKNVRAKTFAHRHNKKN
jgi:hypothetical protein